MAARRLLIIMLVLLGISSVLAIALPKPERDDSTSQEAAVTGETGATGATGETGETGPAAAPDAGAGATATAGQGPGGVATESIQLGEKDPARIKARTGTRMIITVNSLEGSEVEIAGLGLAGFADRYAPAVFDVIFPTEPGRFQVQAPGGKPSAIIVTD